MIYWLRIKIECVSYEDTIINLLYASKQYLNIMEKSQMKDYLEKKKNDFRLPRFNWELFNQRFQTAR